MVAISSELPLLESIQIPRLVLPVDFHYVQLHAFCDCSSHSYSACLYLRSVTVSENLLLLNQKLISLKVLIFFSFFNKIKVNTIPKLELCACVLLCKLVKFDRNIVSEIVLVMLIFAETDSTVSLSWI